MNSAVTQMGTDRGRRIDYVSDHLLLHAGVLTRLLIRDSRSELSRTEAGLLFTLGRGPRRITELAELEGLAQPTVTLLVKKLEGRGLIKRDHPPDDGRVVLLSLTGDGAAALTEFRGQVSAALRLDMQAMSDEQIAALETATDALGALVDLQQAP